MVNPDRTELFIFRNLLSDSSENLSSQSSYVINGHIENINYIKTDFSTNGSLFLLASGTGELLYSQIGGLNANTTQSIFVYGVDSNGNSGSPYTAVKRCVNAPLILIGSGVGASKTGVIEVYYN